MSFKIAKRSAAIMICALAISSMAPAIPAYARTKTHTSGAQSSNERKMRDVAGRVQKSFDKQDMNELAKLCSYPLTVSFAGGNLMEVNSKQAFLDLGNGTVFTPAMLASISAVNVAKLADGGQAGVQMGGDFGLTLYKIKGKWKVNNFYLDAAGIQSSQQAADPVNISKLAEMGEQIQKTFSYGDLETLSRMCNYPVMMSFADGTNQEIQTPAQLIALGESRVFTDQLLKAIDQVDASNLQEVGAAGVQMGGDSGLNLYKFNGYWKINQLYQ